MNWLSSAVGVLGLLLIALSTGLVICEIPLAIAGIVIGSLLAIYGMVSILARIAKGVERTYAR